jgi:DNA-directed RNA polymerase specialized sigma54-like protein
MIFFHDKHWYHSEPLFSVEEEDEDENENENEDEDEDEDEGKNDDGERRERASPTPSQATITSAPASQAAHSRKTEYEFLLFNYLLRFVHREGQIGDFARAGLLFLMNVECLLGNQYID